MGLVDACETPHNAVSIYYCSDIYWTIMHCKHSDVILKAENRNLDVSNLFHKKFCSISLLL